MITGYQAVYDADFQDAILYAANNGFDYVSFDLNVPRFYIDRLEDRKLEEIRSQAENLGIGLAFHAPGDNISLYADYPAIRKGILEHFTYIIHAVERLHARHVTIHPGACPSLKQVNKHEDDFADENRDYFQTVLFDNLSYLANQTQNVLLCIENFNFTPMTIEVVEKLLADNEKLFLTWDIAKTYDIKLRLDKAVEDFMWKHIDRIREVHAHDIIKGFRSHQIIGEGGLDFSRYSSVFIRPDISVTFEVRPREAARLSKDRLITLLDENDLPK